MTLYVIETKPQPPPPPPPPPVANFPPIWPLPASYTNGSTTVKIIPSASFFSVGGKSAVRTIVAAFERYSDLAFPHVAAAVKTEGSVTGLVVTVADDSEDYPQLETDESYTLKIGTDGTATISAVTVYGAMHGLETFSQLVHFDFATETYSIGAAPWAITDAPRFPHRGLMIDSSRHFQTLDSIRMMIDSLPYAKVNVMHWHMSDDQSFPMESKTSPKLWDAAYSDVEKFEQADIADMVEYARMRGVRLMVEFDMPGHATSWCKGYPEICCGGNSVLSPANNATWSRITNLFGEMTGKVASTPGKPSGLFPYNLIHLGGDEVNSGCYGTDPTVAAWLKKMGFNSTDQGYGFFVKKAAEIAMAQGRRPVTPILILNMALTSTLTLALISICRPVQWVEVFDHFGTALDKRTIVHVWKAESTLGEVVSKGYNALINNSPGSNSWYLDHLTIDWAARYGNEPCSAVSDAQCKLVLGGQGEMWGETVDASDIQATVWPGMAAIAERLWSPRDKIAVTSQASKRIASFRCLLNRRGIGAAPVNNGESRSAPRGPGSCLDQ